MKTSLYPWFALVVAGALTAAVGLARAQEDAGLAPGAAVSEGGAPRASADSTDAAVSDAGAGDAAPGGLVPPALLAPITPVYPAEQLAAGLEADVVLRLSIDASGNVSDVEVLQSGGAPFDDAVRSAVLAARFAPASRDGVPSASRIPFRYAFRLPPPAPVVNEPPRTEPPSAPTPQATAAAAPPPREAGPTEVSVRGRINDSQRLAQSAAAVTVVKLDRARRRTADLGEVLSRIPGISIRRGGSLGSDFRLSMNGLIDDQIRTFVDGVPIEFMFSATLANIPVNLLDHAEVYRGVVPIRLASDALGGAIQLVRPQRYETSGTASYQIGSFGAHRATLSARYRDETSGFVMGFDGFFDDADNDYKVDVQVPDDKGRLSPARVRRFHDHYRAYLAAVEVGMVDQPWAKKLMLRFYTSAVQRELQNNIVMTVPYGEAHYGIDSDGGLLTYEHTLFRRVKVELLANYTKRNVAFTDKSKWVYDWFGRRVNERGRRGEYTTPPADQNIWQHTGFGRLTLEFPIALGHSLVVNTSPQYDTRTGENRLNMSMRDPLTAEARMFKLVSGAEYTARFMPMPKAPAQPDRRRSEDYRLENVLFAKAYTFRAWLEETLPGNIFKKRHRDSDTFGIGDTLRAYVLEWLIVKASYEYATRLPRPDELFGDGVLIKGNPELRPEVTHNANLGPRAEFKLPGYGDWLIDVNAFLRDTDRQIVLLGNERDQKYQNIYYARTVGVEGSVQWTSPGRWLELQTAATYQEQRNYSNKGTFEPFNGDRIPNRPWLFASWAGQLHFERLLTKDDELEPFYQGRFVQEFYRSWESAGEKKYKQVIDGQVAHNVGVTYGLGVGPGHVDATFEVQNVSDAKLFDFFGAQRPGRAFYAKISGDL